MKLANFLKIPHVSADCLEDEVMARTPAEIYASLFPHAVTKGDSNDIFYSSFKTDRIVADYVQQAASSRDAIIHTIVESLENKADLIIEGHQVTPEIASEMEKRFGCDKIKSIFLLKYGVEGMVRDFAKSTTPNDWILRKTKSLDTFPKIAYMIAAYSQLIENDAKKRGLSTIHMDYDFEHMLQKAIDMLTRSRSDRSAVR